MKNYKKLRCWQQAIDLSERIFILTKDFPKRYQVSLISQLEKSALSIPSNIAEGSSRGSDRDYKRFLEYSLGSCFELETQLIVSFRLSLLSKDAFDKLNESVVIQTKMIHKLIKAISQ